MLANLVLRLRRITSGGRYIPQVDGLRFVAITWVVLFHLYGYLSKYSGDQAGVYTASRSWLGSLIQRGSYGVELFFVLSGFVLGVPFAAAAAGRQSPVQLRRYFLRRLTRLEPPFLLNVVLCTLSAVVLLHQPVVSLIKHALATALYMHQLVYGIASSLNVVTWSLEIEVQFYCLAPLLALFFYLPYKNIRKFGWGVLIITTAVVGRILGSHIHILTHTIFGYMPYFLAGFFLADLEVDQTWASTQGRLWDALGLLGWCSVVVAVGAVLPFPQVAVSMVLPLAIALAYLGTLRGQTLAKLASGNFVTVAGGMCYTIYLYHYLVISAAGRITRPIGFSFPFLEYAAIQFVILITAVTVASTVLFILIERPCMDPRWPTQLMNRIRGHRTLANVSILEQPIVTAQASIPEITP